MVSFPNPSSRQKYGGWLSSNPEVLSSFINDLLKLAQEVTLSDTPTQHLPAVREFKEAIEGDAVMKHLIDDIFLQVSKLNKIWDFETLLTMLDHILPSAPPYYVTTDSQGKLIAGPIGSPIESLVVLWSNTMAGYDLFRLPQFNLALKSLLNAWGRFLSDPNGTSHTALHSGVNGWFGKNAITEFELGIYPKTFDETYAIPDVNAEHRGFKTWDAFFTRKLREGVRPVDFAANKDIIHSPCEGTVCSISYNVAAYDRFWLKGKKYSLYDMLNKNKAMASYFAGGTVYQHLLSCFDYHRWHAPIDGTIEKIEQVDGSYYAVLLDEDVSADNHTFPPTGTTPYDIMIRCMPYISAIATRALVYIKADNPDIGLVCFIAIGMVEISTCEVTVRGGQRVRAGDELGLFHYGGSSSVLVLPPQCKVTFAREAGEGEQVWVNSVIGRVNRR
ncbi:phosphatidylserine decarboxylase [Athelia psychrophila]|uniref:Phosphatidylserine decarboxylase n=1 Tax=Athelia psychrophila TaxID=1759441 RepID=A0A166T3W1_9AGAM|nr:phosphatidylserine decarboxylase [Fibularhizoctonia sp. CBS 109695]